MDAIMVWWLQFLSLSPSEVAACHEHQCAWALEYRSLSFLPQRMLFYSRDDMMRFIYNVFLLSVKNATLCLCLLILPLLYSLYLCMLLCFTMITIFSSRKLRRLTIPPTTRQQTGQRRVLMRRRRHQPVRWDGWRQSKTGPASWSLLRHSLAEFW